MDQEITFKMKLDGEEVVCTVLFTFSSDETGASYMLYTPDDPTGEQPRLMAARFDPTNMTALYPLEDEKDRVIVQSVIDYVTSHSGDEMAEDAEEDDGILTVEDLPS